MDGASREPFFTLRGFGNFRQQVVFAKVDDGSELVKEIGQCVKDGYEKRGIYSTDQRPLNLYVILDRGFVVTNSAPSYHY